MADIRTWAEALQAAQSELPDSSDALANINSATLGTSMPVVTLPNGQKVQTGTVGALLVNIKSYDEIMGKAHVDERMKQELEEKMSASLQLLKPIGMFDLFSPEEWTQGMSAGRKFCGEKAVEAGY